MADRLDTPKEAKRTLLPRVRVEQDAFGRASEGIARFMGTPRFLVYMTAFCITWLVWNVWGPENLQFDSAALGFTALTLMLSLQASYSAPLILLAQNRQTDRDRVTAEHDRQLGERNLADTEYLAREMAALRIALSEVATRDFVRSEIRNLLEEIATKDSARDAEREAERDAEREAERGSERGSEDDSEPAAPRRTVEKTPEKGRGATREPGSGQQP